MKEEVPTEWKSDQKLGKKVVIDNRLHPLQTGQFHILSNGERCGLQYL